MRTLGLTTLFVSSLIVAGCGDDGMSGTENGSTSTASTTDASTSTDGTTTTAGTTGTTEEPTTGGTTTAGTTGGGELLNECDPATAEDHTGEPMVTVMQMGLDYNPPCIRISAGSSVMFMSDFAAHPLVGGVVAGGMKMPDATSPIAATSSGTEASFTFATAGSYGYYCDLHALSGMVGAVFVE